jgi:hypothetical protein
MQMRLQEEQLMLVSSLCKALLLVGLPSGVGEDLWTRLLLLSKLLLLRLHELRLGPMTVIKGQIAIGTDHQRTH